MKKITLAVLVAVAFMVVASGCEFKNTMIYEGKERPVSEVEEIVEDKLEFENHNLDLEVTIAEEKETKKKSKRK